MEASRDKGEVFAIIRKLAEMLRAPELKSLRRAFNVWTKGLLKRQTRDYKIVEAIDGINDIFEEYDMAETVYEYWDDVIREKALSDGKAELLIRQLSHRFGPLPKWAESRVIKAKSAQLEKWATAVFDASSLAEVLGTPTRK